MYQHQRLTEMMLKVKAESMRCCSVTTWHDVGSAKCMLAHWYQAQKTGAHMQVAGMQFGIKTCQQAMSEGRQARFPFCTAGDQLLHSQTSGYLVPYA